MKKLFAKKTAPKESTISAKSENQLPANAFEMALEQHQLGNLAQADALYRQILQQNPHHADALHFLGVLAYQVGQHEAAVELISKAVEIDATSASVYCNLGLAYQALGRFDAAIAQYQKALTLQPDSVEAFYNLALAFQAQGQLDQAITYYQQVISHHPEFAQAHNNLGLIFHIQERLDDALKCFQQAISIQPDYSDAYFNQGNVLASQHKIPQAIECYRRGLSFNPNNPQVYSNLGYLLKEQGQLSEAVEIFQQLLTLTPNDAKVHYNLGILFYEQKNFDAAIASLQKTISLAPDYVEGYVTLASALNAENKPQAGIENLQKAITLNPNYVEAYHDLGLMFKDQERLDEAVENLQKSLALKPDLAEAHANLGSAFSMQNKDEEALAHYRQALALGVDSALIHTAMGGIFQNQDNLEAALEHYQIALTANPDYAEAHYGLGNLYSHQGKLEQALQCYQTAVAIKPDYLDAHNNLGLTLRKQNKLDEAIDYFHYIQNLDPNYWQVYNNLASLYYIRLKLDLALENYQKAIAMEPDNLETATMLFEVQLRCCDWSNYAKTREKFSLAVAAGELKYEPFGFLNLTEKAALQQKCAADYAKKHFPAATTSSEKLPVYQHDKIRVAYLSADLGEHPITFLMAGLFEKHDRQRFEIYAISFTPEYQSITGQRVKNTFQQRFIDVSKLSHQEVASLMRELEIDIAVDLMGYTWRSRTPIFAYRPAPIQVNYLGYPATMGVDYIDYIFADPYLIPPEQQDFYSEKIVYLPDCFQVNDDKRIISADRPIRLEVGLPLTGFVFCAFNTSNKINPDFFDIWMRLLQAVPGSVLWLVADHPLVMQNLTQEAKKRGVAAERLKFAPRLSYAQHLARFQLADLFLDTLPFNAGTTASDALWAGVPVLTCSGEAFAARMAGSLLHAIGLPELITENLQDYEALALKLATNPAQLAEIKARLVKNRPTFPLFNTDRFRQHLEAAYISMWERHQKGEAPVSFSLPPLA